MVMVWKRTKCLPTLKILSTPFFPLDKVPTFSMRGKGLYKFILPYSQRMRTSSDEYRNGKLWNGYDYDKQEWVFEGKKDTRTLEEIQEAVKKEREARALAVTEGKSDWYKVLLARANDFAKGNNLSEEATENLTNLLLSTARDQFRMGNRSGIAWMHNKLKEEAQEKATPCPECFATDGQHLRSSCTE